jgi:hypothetical protein
MRPIPSPIGGVRPPDLNRNRVGPTASPESSLSGIVGTRPPEPGPDGAGRMDRSR